MYLSLFSVSQPATKTHIPGDLALLADQGDNRYVQFSQVRILPWCASLGLLLKPAHFRDISSLSSYPGQPELPLFIFTNAPVDCPQIESEHIERGIGGSVDLFTGFLTLQFN